MKQSRRLSILSSLLLTVGLISFIPTASAEAAASCSGATCSQTFTYSASTQTFTPPSAGVNLTITLNGGSGGRGGGDAGGAGGTGLLGSRVVFQYTPSTVSPLYLYPGNAGSNGSGGSCNGQGAGGANFWAAYAGGTGGYAGCQGSSGGGAGGGAASVLSTGDKSGVIAVAGGGAGGGGANINAPGVNAIADTGTQSATTNGANGGTVGGGDGAGGGGGGAGYTGGIGGAAAYDGWNPAGGGGVSGRSFPQAPAATVTSNVNSGNGSITISWPNGPSASTLPSFTTNTSAKVGQVLTPVDGTFVPSAGAVTISNRRWQISTDGITFTDISPLATGNYTIKASDASKYVRFAEDATDSSNTITYGSAASLQITDVPAFTAETPGTSTVLNVASTPYTFVASGYRNVYTVSAGALPAGMTLNSSTGVLSGTPTATGTFTYKVKATNEAGSDETVELTLVVGKAPVFTSDDSVLESVTRFSNPIRVGAALANFVFTAASYPAATFELKTDSTTIPACGVAPNCANSFETLGLPDGLTFNAATATLSGTPTKVGAYVFAIKASNSLGSSLEFVHMAIASKAPAGFALSSDKNAVTIVQNTTVTATITASGGSGSGAYSFSVDPASSAICSVTSATATTATMTVLAAGNCVINGVKAADGGFAAAKASVTVFINKAAQTATIVTTADSSPLIYGGSSTWLRATGGNGTGAITFSVDPSTSSVCTAGTPSGNNYYVAFSSAGTCKFNVTKAGDAYFLPQTTQFTIQIDKGQITGLYIGQPADANWNGTTPPSRTLSTGGGQGTGAVTYTLDPTSAAVCSLVNNVLTAKSAGSCIVTATKAGDINYKPMTSAAVTWTINQIYQPALSATGATQAGVNIPYNSSSVQYVADPAVLAVITVTGGAGTGSYTYVASNTSGCVVSGAGPIAYITAAPTGNGVGWCTISITKNGDVNYAAQTTNFQFYIPQGPQNSLVATPGSTSIDFVPSTLTDAATAAKTQISVTGGLGTGAVTYAVAAGSTSVCSVDANGLITDKTAGTCVVNITKASDLNYLVQTTTATVTFNKLNQAELVANPADSTKAFTWSPKATSQITTNGGSGTGAVTYAVASGSTTVCSVNASNGLITDITAGTCVITVTKAADTNYNVATDTVTVEFTKINPAAISLSAAPASIAYTTAASKNQTWVTVSGGSSSTGEFVFYVDPMTEDYCSISTVQATRVLVNGNLAGLCLITVVHAADVNYFEQRAFMGLTITKMVQTIGASSSMGLQPYFKESPTAATTINVTGQAGTGVTRFVVDSANSTSNCSVDQMTGNVTSPNIGTCKITVSRDGDDNVQASNSVVISLTISKINQGLVTLTPNADFKFAPGANKATSSLTFGLAYTGTGNFTKISSLTPAVCTITGGGDSTLNPPTFTATATPSITVTALDDGTCTLIYTKLGDTNFNVANSYQASFVINKATQADITASITVGSASMPFVSSPKATATILGAGGSGTGIFNYIVDAASTGICTSNATTGVVTDVTAGVCVINVKRISDGDYVESVVKQVTITFTKIDQSALGVTAGKVALRATTSALDTTTLSTTGGSGTGAVTYVVDANSSTVCSISGTTVTGLGAGDCNITVTKAADSNYNAATATIKLTVTKGTQSTFTAAWWYLTNNGIGTQANPVSFNSSTDQINYLVTNGGAGSGDLVYSIDPSSAAICATAKIRPGYPNQIIVSALGDGECKVKVYKSGGTAWDNSNEVAVSFWIGKIAQATLTATASKSTLTYFGAPANTFKVAVTGGSGTGAASVSINAASAAICADATVANGVLTVKTLGVGNCLLTVVKAASPGYSQVTSAQITVSITKGTQSNLNVSASPAVLTYAASPKATSTITVTGGSGSGAVTVAVDSGSTAICSYNSVTGAITALQAGKCELTATKAADALFNVATGKLSITINKVAQAKLTLTPVSPFLKFVESPKATTVLNLAGGTGTGAVSYTLDPGSSSVCTLDVTNGVASITANYFGYCVVTATKAGDKNFADATATATVRIAQPGTQISASVPDTTVGYVAAPGVATTVTVDGSLEGDIISYSVDAASKNVCSVAGNGSTAQVTTLGQGTCTVLAINVSRAPDGTLIASSSIVILTIVKGNQTNVVVTPATPSVYFATPAATDVITVTGGVANSTITAIVDASSAGNCSVAVVGNKITMTALRVGDCLINITKAGDAGYNAYATSLTIPILKTKQAAFNASASPSSIIYAANSVLTSTITTVGGSGTGAVTYALSEASTTICSISGNVITVITGGDCVVVVTKAGDVNYSEASTAVTVRIAKGTQAVFSLTADSTSLTYNKDTNASTTVSAVGGSGLGDVTYAVAQASAAICSLEGDLVTVLRPGTCTINATKASDPYFNAASASVSITIAKSEQDALIAKLAPGELQVPLWNGKSTTQIIITGGDGYGALTLVGLTPTVCSVALAGQRVNVTSIAAGTCQFKVTRESDYAFLASTALTHTLTVGSAETDLFVSVSSAGKTVAGGKGAIDLTVTNNGPAKAAGATVEYTLPTGITAVAPLGAGCVLTSSTEVTCSTNKVLDVDGSVRFTIPVALAGSLVGGEYTDGGAATLSSATPDSNLANNEVSGEDANFVVNKAPTAFNKTTINPLQTGKVFEDQLTAVGFPAVTYTISAGDLPAGLTLDEATGAITGTPTGVGKYGFTVSAYNSAGAFSQAYSGNIAPAPFVTVPAVGFATNTVPAGTKITVGGVNLDLVTNAIIGGKTVKFTKTATLVTLEVPNGTTGEVPVSLVYGQGTIDAGTFTYTGPGKVTPVIVVDAGELIGGAGESARTLTSSITATGVSGEVVMPVVYSSKTTAVCTVAGNQLTFISAGTCTVGATTAATAAFNAATSATVSIVLTKTAQTLNIVQPTKPTDSSDGFDLDVTASSGLVPAFVSATPLICDVTDDGHVTGLKAGRCELTITQPGDARFAAIAATKMEFDIATDAGLPVVDNGDPLHPTSLASGKLTKFVDVGFSWDKKLAALKVETYGIFIGKINAVSEFTIAGKAYKCSVDFGILKAMASKTPAQYKLAMAKKTFKAASPFCNAKTETAAYSALKAGYVGLDVKVTIIRYRMFPTTYLPVNAKTKKPILTQTRVIYITLG